MADLVAITMPVAAVELCEVFNEIVRRHTETGWSILVKRSGIATPFQIGLAEATAGEAQNIRLTYDLTWSRPPVRGAMGCELSGTFLRNLARALLHEDAYAATVFPALRVYDAARLLIIEIP